MESARLALALLRLEGVGTVTAGRLLTHFPTYADLRRYPREQVLTRIKGAPRAEALVATLFDDEAMQPHLKAAHERILALQQKRVQVLTRHSPHWSPRLDDLPRSSNPPVLYLFGNPAMLAARSVAFFGHPPLPPPAFEAAQALVRHLRPHDLRPLTGAEHGLDVVVHKLTNSEPEPGPSVLVAAAGLAHIAPAMRPIAMGAVRAAGALVSPFPMDHGPFAHDEKLRALLMAAMASACVFIAPAPDTPAWHALHWALDAGRPVFGLAGDTPLPERVHPLRDDTDHDWVVAAAKSIA